MRASRARESFCSLRGMQLARPRLGSSPGFGDMDGELLRRGGGSGATATGGFIGSAAAAAGAGSPAAGAAAGAGSAAPAASDAVDVGGGLAGGSVDGEPMRVVRLFPSLFPHRKPTVYIEYPPFIGASRGAYCNPMTVTVGSAHPAPVPPPTRAILPFVI